VPPPTADTEIATQLERVIRRVKLSMNYRGSYSTRDILGALVTRWVQSGEWERLQALPREERHLGQSVRRFILDRFAQLRRRGRHEELDEQLVALPDEPTLVEMVELAQLRQWITLARERIAFQGLPARICWLGQGDRARFALAINDLVARGEISAPIVIGRDHLDTGSVASPFRETEGMRDGSDAIADWAILNAMLNVASGASWVSFHHGGGVGIGNSLHAGQVIVADGSERMRKRLARVLTNDPGIGVARHADAGYEIAIATAEREGLRLPMRDASIAR